VAGLLRLPPEPPPGYAAFVAQHLDGAREDATRMVGDVAAADRLYPEVLTDVAVRWGWLELRRRLLHQPDAAEEYLRRALDRRWQRWQAEQHREVEPVAMVDIRVLPPDGPGPRRPAPHRFGAPRSAAVRLAPQLAPAARPASEPVAEAAIAWWHAHETRRRRRWLAALLAALVLAVGLARLQSHSADAAGIRPAQKPPGYVQDMYSTTLSRHVAASRPAVYRALLDPDAIAKWRVPAGMSSQVHEFDAREGGSFRVSLTYDAPDATGKSASHTDTYHGQFRSLVPDEQVVEVFEFETADPALRGSMTMTTTLTDSDGGTEVRIVHEGIPDAIPAADNETGTRMALANLARLVEAGGRPEPESRPGT
jgi:uncharacterized protein YndB with AHSA1/START domain